MTDEAEKKGSNNVLKTQLSMFSIIPIDSTQEDVEKFCSKFWTVPLFGLVFGLILGFIFLISTYLFSIGPAAVITILMGHVLNRFLHFDGLMDFGDGMVAHGDIEKKTKALKDSNVGAGGVGIGILIAFLTISALSTCAGVSVLSNHWQLAVLFFPIAAEVLAKNSLYITAAYGKAAGSGLGNMFVNSANTNDVLKSILVSAVIVIPLAILMLTGPFFSIVESLLVGILMILINMGVGFAVCNVAMKSFGYVNGDVLGASNELGKVGALLGALIVLCLL